MSFEEAATVFSDADALDWDDPEHSESELRSKRIGASITGRILIVCYAPRSLIACAQGVDITEAGKWLKANFV